MKNDVEELGLLLTLVLWVVSRVFWILFWWPLFVYSFHYWRG